MRQVGSAAAGEGDSVTSTTPLRTEPAPRSGWERYELAKQAWIEQHPEATPAEYTAAMQQIARACGV